MESPEQQTNIEWLVEYDRDACGQLIARSPSVALSARQILYAVKNTNIATERPVRLHVERLARDKALIGRKSPAGGRGSIRCLENTAGKKYGTGRT